MNWRLIAVTALSLGLSQLAFPAEMPVLISTPTLLEAVAEPVATPLAIRELMPALWIKASRPKPKSMPRVSHVLPGDTRPLRAAYWTAERVGSAAFTYASRVVDSPPMHLGNAGDPRFANGHQPAFRLTIRI